MKFQPKSACDAWNSFALLTKDPVRIEELNGILARHTLSYREIMVLVTSLQIRPESREADFDAMAVDPMSVVSIKERELIQTAAALEIPIIIDGDRSRPTGKSTLCDHLRKHGALVYEGWELEETAKQLINPEHNSVIVEIRLNKAL